MLDLAQLNAAVDSAAAFRRRRRLQPAGGKGDKIFPPTYPGEGRNAPPRHVYERRRIDGREIWCVLIDSVQSQANRLEECLLRAINERRDGLRIPYVLVDFAEAGLDGITTITSLDAPHRVYDAILRDSLLDSTPFMESAVGRHLAKAKPEDAAALLEVSPTALLFGAWHSTGEGGGLGAKFARCLISEIVGIDVPVERTIVDQRTGESEVRTAGRRTASRIDPIGTLREVKIYQSAENPKDWTPDETEAAKDDKGKPILFSRKKGDKAGKPSVINHGNIRPSVQPLGVTCEYVEHSFVLSLAALRRLRFGTTARDTAGRSLLAALGLVALAEQDARGYALRSRCDLVCEDSVTVDLVLPDGTTSATPIDRAVTRALYSSAVKAAENAGFTLSAGPIRLLPQDKLIEIVRQSQRLALAGKGGEEEEPEEAK